MKLLKSDMSEKEKVRACAFYCESRATVACVAMRG